MVTVLLPTSTGAVNDQLVVPEAVPDPPVDVVQWTEVTPTLSLAVPLIATEARDVESINEDGDVTVSVGGVVSLGFVVGGFADGGLDAGGLSWAGSRPEDLW